MGYVECEEKLILKEKKNEAKEIVQFFLYNFPKKGDSGGTQTRDTQNRNLMLYSTELRSQLRYNDKGR